MTQPQPNHPQPKHPQAAQARAKIEQMKRTWEQKRSIADSLSQIKSKIGFPRDQRATLQTLGLRKIRQQVIRPDNPAVRGLIKKVRHLITVEEAD